MLKTDLLSTVKELVKLLDEKDGKEIVVLDMEDSGLMVDYFVIVTGNSEPHMSALRDEVVKFLKGEDIPILFYDKGKGSDWLIIDTGTFIIHIFSEEGREFYDLESLWGEQNKAIIK